jgi:protocatechuate 3,4-dioxygenase beta subunit
MPPVTPAPITRRRALTLIATTVAGGVMVPQRFYAQSSATDTAPLLPGADVCVLTPEVAQGPFYFDPGLVRADITEGRPGVPIVVRMQVVDATCRPQPGARADIWHCDARGHYSNYPGPGQERDRPASAQRETFLRGTQMADDHGIVTFASIYPGWYPGRTPHIHFKVFLDSSNVLTGQLFFPDALSEFIYRNVPPYADRAARRDVLNDGDFLARQASRASFASVKEEERAYLVSLIVGVDPATRSGSGRGFGPPPGGPPPPGRMPRGGPGDPLEGRMGRGDRSGSLVPGVPGIGSGK